jgi:PAS domain S-box-containing protein
MLPSRILIVEDEAIVALDLADRLAAFGYDIIGTAADGAVAQELVRTKSPDLILMDIQIKGDIDGIETAERIRLRYDIPIIFLTANSDEQTVRRAKITGPFGYLLKPFEERELHTTIEMALYRHQLEQKVRESEHWLNTTLRCIGDGVIATDYTGKIKFINSIAERITGWSAADACGQEIEQVFNIIAECDNSPMTSPVRTALATREIVLLKNHTLLIRKDGIRLPIDDSSAPIIDDTNEIVGAVLVFRDVTERVKAEKAILVSEQRYNDLFNSVREGIGVTNEHEVIEFCNPALLQIFEEKTLQDVVGRTFLMYIPEDQLAIFNTHLETHKTGVFLQFEIDIVTQKGIRKSILISTSPRLDENGVYRGTFSSILDITARRMAEEKLKEYQNQLEDLVLQRTGELEKAYHTLKNEIVERKRLEEQRQEMEEKLHRAEKMESLGLLAGGVAHDLNNMLGPLVAYPELILNKLPNDSPVRKMVERISNSANDAANVIQDLLTLARRGRYELHSVNLNRVVESYLDSPAFLILQIDRPEILL